jgi:hypothetical protein
LRIEFQCIFFFAFYKVITISWYRLQILHINLGWPKSIYIYIYIYILYIYILYIYIYICLNVIYSNYMVFVSFCLWYYHLSKKIWTVLCLFCVIHRQFIRRLAVNKVFNCLTALAPWQFWCWDEARTSLFDLDVTHGRQVSLPIHTNTLIKLMLYFSRLLLFFKVLFIPKCIKMIFFYFLKIMFDISTSKQSKT